jgi:uncharacterized membrane protein
MTDPKKALRIWILASVVILTLPVVLFALKFSSLPFSDKPDDWTNFSVYFSSIINPLLMCINILLLIKLTYEVANYNEKNMRNDMRQRAYTEISKSLFSLTSILKNSGNKQRDLILLRNDIISFSNTMKHLFSFANFETITDELDDSLKLLSESDYIKKDLTFNEDSDEYRIFLELFERFNATRMQFINDLQKSILN